MKKISLKIFLFLFFILLSHSAYATDCADQMGTWFINWVPFSTTTVWQYVGHFQTQEEAAAAAGGGHKDYASICDAFGGGTAGVSYGDIIGTIDDAVASSKTTWISGTGTVSIKAYATHADCDCTEDVPDATYCITSIVYCPNGQPIAVTYLSCTDGVAQPGSEGTCGNPEEAQALVDGMVEGTRIESSEVCDCSLTWDDLQFYCSTYTASECDNCQTKDDDNDGVNNCIDVCPDTIAGAEVSKYGCDLELNDDDGDGVPDAIDQCPDTPGGPVDAFGCYVQEDEDTDLDGVPDVDDDCPNTPPGFFVDSHGCITDSETDTDGDGVPDSIDQEPNTPPGSTVDSNGVTIEVVQDDGDPTTGDMDTDGPLLSSINDWLNKINSNTDGLEGKLDQQNKYLDGIEPGLSRIGQGIDKLNNGVGQLNDKFDKFAENKEYVDDPDAIEKDDEALDNAIGDYMTELNNSTTTSFLNDSTIENVSASPVLNIENPINGHNISIDFSEYDSSFRYFGNLFLSMITLSMGLYIFRG